MTADLHFDRTSTPLGTLLLVAAGDVLAGVEFAAPGHRAGAGRAPDHPLLARAKLQLAEYFAGERTVFDLPLAETGTPFQQAVWTAIRGVRHGETISYRELAVRAGAPRAIRAAGAATGRNPWAIVVPCHRIVGADGSLTGYAGGIEVKRALLALEARRPLPRAA